MREGPASAGFFRWVAITSRCPPGSRLTGASKPRVPFWVTADGWLFLVISSLTATKSDGNLPVARRGHTEGKIWGSSATKTTIFKGIPLMRIHPDLNSHEIDSAEALARISPLLERIRPDRVDEIIDFVDAIRLEGDDPRARWQNIAEPMIEVIERAAARYGARGRGPAEPAEP